MSSRKCTQSSVFNSPYEFDPLPAIKYVYQDIEEACSPDMTAEEREHTLVFFERGLRIHLLLELVMKDEVEIVSFEDGEPRFRASNKARIV